MSLPRISCAADPAAQAHQCAWALLPAHGSFPAAACHWAAWEPAGTCQYATYFPLLIILTVCPHTRVRCVIFLSVPVLITLFHESSGYLFCLFTTLHCTHKQNNHKSMPDHFGNPSVSITIMVILAYLACFYCCFILNQDKIIVNPILKYILKPFQIWKDKIRNFIKTIQSLKLFKSF